MPTEEPVYRVKSFVGWCNKPVTFVTEIIPEMDREASEWIKRNYAIDSYGVALHTTQTQMMTIDEDFYIYRITFAGLLGNEP